MQVIRVLNNVTWQPLLECHHGSPVDEPPDVAIYEEVEDPKSVLAPVQASMGWFWAIDVWLEKAIPALL
jgi:hypothetical protein